MKTRTWILWCVLLCGGEFSSQSLWAMGGDFRDEASYVPLRMVVCDKKADFQVRRSAAQSLPADERKEVFLSLIADRGGWFYYRLWMARELSSGGVHRGLEFLVQDKSLEDHERLGVAQELPEDEKNRALLSLVSDSKMGLRYRSRAAQLLPEDERSEAFRTLMGDKSVRLWLRIGLAQSLPENHEVRVQSLTEWALHPTTKPKHRFSILDLLPEAVQKKLLWTWALDDSSEDWFRAKAVESLSEGHSKMEILVRLGRKIKN